MKNLEQAKQLALEAKKAYLLPRYIANIKQELCWQGRIARAMDLANDAILAGDKERKEILENAIKQLEADMASAGQDADATLKTYRDMGGTEPLDVGLCPCHYCQRNQQQDALWMAESRLRRAVFDLTEPGDDGKPLPLALMSQQTDDAQQTAWKLFLELCNAQANYKSICERLQKAPAWGYVLRAW